MSIREFIRERDWIWVAHRGNSAHCPENTLVSFERALSAEMDMLEFDVQLTKDAEIVVIHDSRLDRTTSGSGYVWDHTLSEIRKLDAGSWFGERFANIQVPTLDEVLESFPQAFLNIELKPSPFDDADILTRRVLRCIRDHRATNRVLISSFDHVRLHTARTISDSIALGALYVGRLWPLFALPEKLALTTLHPSLESLDANFNQQAEAKGYKILTWTIENRAQLDYATANGAHGVFVNDADLKPVFA